MTEAACKCAETLAKHRSGGATEHRVTVTHTGPAAEVAVGVRVRQGGEGDGHRSGGRSGGSEHRPDAQALAHAPEPALRSPDAGREPVPVAGDIEGPLPAARRSKGQRRA
jgi:hypothetical protein